MTLQPTRRPLIGYAADTALGYESQETRKGRGIIMIEAGKVMRWVKFWNKNGENPVVTVLSVHTKKVKVLVPVDEHRSRITLVYPSALQELNTRKKGERS